MIPSCDGAERRPFGRRNRSKLPGSSGRATSNLEVTGRFRWAGTGESMAGTSTLLGVFNVFSTVSKLQLGGSLL